MAKVSQTAAFPRGVLCEVTNTAAHQGAPARHAKGKGLVEANVKERETPEQVPTATNVILTPQEYSVEVKVEVDPGKTELDASHSSFVGASGRTIDLQTGEELVYDLSKVVMFDYLQEKKLEEYSLYVEEAIRYDRRRELDPQFHVDATYIERHNDITWTMRSTLMIWLVELRNFFALSDETLHLSARIVDLFLTKLVTILPRNRLQLLGLTAIFLSSKYEERSFVPSGSELVYMTANSYTVAELLAMEEEILKTIGFQLGHPLSFWFLGRFAKIRQLSMKCLLLAQNILTSSLPDHSFLGVRDSHMAAGALYLARRMVMSDDDPWDDTLIHYSAVGKETARNMALRFNAMIRKLKEVGRGTLLTKYRNRVFKKVGVFPRILDTAL